MLTYVANVGSKTCTGDKSCDNTIVSAYARSLFLFMVPPLVANDILGEAEARKIWVDLGKKMGGVPQTVNSQLWTNLTFEGDKCAVIQCMDLARRLKSSLNPARAHKKRMRVQRQQSEMERRLNKFKPPQVEVLNTHEENLRIIKLQKELADFKEKRAKFPLSNDDVLFISAINRGKLTVSYNSMAHCRHCNELVDKNHMQKCPLF